MSNAKNNAPISETLRRAIVKSGVPLLVLERETGVPRTSVRRFVAGKHLRTDMADRLAVFFGLHLTKRKGK